MSSMRAPSVVRIDPALDRIVPPAAQVEKVAAGLGRTEGPLWIRGAGYLLFSDLNAIRQWMPGEGVSVYHDRTFSGPAPAGRRVGTNGLTLDPEGRLIACEHGNRRISRWERNGSVTVLADRFENQRFNSPNDLVCKRNGEVYFTDPPYFDDLKSSDRNPLFRRDMNYSGVYRVTGAGKVELLIEDLTFPNGLAFSPDEKKFYIANTEPKKFWRVYDVRADGTLTNGAELLDGTGLPGEEVPDGMKVDTDGNLYLTGPGGVLVLSAQGKHLGTIPIPEIAANCAWGDADGKALYITARTGLYRIRMHVAGVWP